MMTDREREPDMTATATAITAATDTHDEHGVAWPNPVVKTTALRAYPGWVVREYADGTYSSSDERGVAWAAVDTFAMAVAFARSGGREYPEG